MGAEVTINTLIECIPEIEQLNLKFSEFNPFKVLGVTDTEIRHSNTIAWLLNPKENHGIGQLFFKTLLRKIISASENESIENTAIGMREIILNDFTDLKVYREDTHIDILCVSDSNKIVVIIENKIYSGEHGNQLNKYLQNIRGRYKNYICLPVYLSIEGLKPNHTEYYAASYQHILETIEHIKKLLGERIPQKVLDFLLFYQKIIEEKTMTDQNLQEIAKKIYKDHQAAIDFIHTAGKSIDFIEPGIKVISKRKNLLAISPNFGWFGFVDKEFVIKNKLHNDWAKGNPVQYWIAQYYDKLKICLEVGPFDSGKDRLDFLLELEKGGIKIRPSSKTEAGTYTRIYTQTTEINDWQDQAELEEKMELLVNNRELERTAETVKSVIKNHKTFWE